MASLSDAFRAHPLINLHHKQYPDLNSLQEVPESYAWVQGNHEYSSGDHSSAVDDPTVPVIDLTNTNATQQIGHACRTWGVFQIVNHGIPSSLFDKVEGLAKNLFSLPKQQKLTAARSPDGVSGYGTARISSFFPKLMWYEGFTIVGSPVHHFRQLWPQDYNRYCEIIEEYEKEINHLSRHLLLLMLNALGIVKEDLKWVGNLNGACAAIQLNSYPVCPDPDKAMGLAGHTDSTLLTVLRQTNTSGLQVLRDGMKWVDVPPVQGALVVNTGDLLHILTNGIYPSVFHRVRVNRIQNRFSIAYLYGPPQDIQISPHPNFCGPNCPPLYRTVTWNEYLGVKAKLFNEALSSLIINNTARV